MGRPPHLGSPRRRRITMRSLELRRHARREPAADRLSQEGRAQAQDVGRTLPGGYAVIFASPAKRTAETVAWFLRALGEQLPPHDVVAGLGGEDPSPEGMASTVRDLLARIPEGGRGLA